MEENFPNVMVIEDAAYFCYTNDGFDYVPFFSIDPNNWCKTFTCFSGGKIFNTTGNFIYFLLNLIIFYKKNY